jgi:hypothetical protein
VRGWYSAKKWGSQCIVMSFGRNSHGRTLRRRKLFTIPPAKRGGWRNQTAEPEW